MTEKTAEKHDESEAARVYEVGYHIVPTVKEDAIDGVVGTIRSVVEKIGGSFIAEGAPELMRLAYPMEHRENDKNIEYDRAYFGWIKFEAPAEGVKTLDHALKTNADILRFITFRTVREDTRARLKLATLREVRRTDTLRTAPRHVEETAAPVSEESIDKAIEELTTE